MIRTRRTSSIPQSSRAGFTLIELLIVLAIIGLLAAILFPAFRNAQERGAQTSCASNLKQIYQAVELYRQDEKMYPGSLAFLLPSEFEITKGATTTTVDGQSCAGTNCPNPSGTGFFKGGRDALICNDDDTDSQFIRSSYGNLSTEPPAAGTPEQADMTNYIWNYWGYRAKDKDTTTCSDDDASGCAGTAFQTDEADYHAQFRPANAADDCQYCNVPTEPFNATTNMIAPAKLPRLANRFAPTSTIITHCVYHRLPTAGGKLAFPYEMTTNPENGAMARDIVLRRDGSAQVLDVSKFHETDSWAKQNF